MTPAQKQALTELRKHGGEGIIDKHGRLMAAGVRLTMVAPETWLRLVTTGHVIAVGPLRLALTDAGRAESFPESPRVNPHGIHGRQEPIPAHPGAE